MKNPIYPCLWFEKDAIEAAKFYCEIFPEAKIISENPYVVHFSIQGSRIMLLNGGKHHQLSEAVSLVVECETQEEIDYYWEKLLQNGGKEKACGWLVDQYGLCWQIVPTIIGELMSNPETMGKTFEALQSMIKFDIQALIEASRK